MGSGSDWRCFVYAVVVDHVDVILRSELAWMLVNWVTTIAPRCRCHCVVMLVVAIGLSTILLEAGCADRVHWGGDWTMYVQQM